MRVVCDLEANGLDPTRIFCIVCIDIDTLQEYIFKEGELSEFIQFYTRVDTWIGHNFLCYDLPALRKILHVNIRTETVVDTLILSRLFNPIRSGGHALDNWGTLLGDAKLKHEDWTVFSPQMLDRCIQDVRLTIKVYHQLMNEGKNFSAKSIKIEHLTQQILDKQRKYGFKLDMTKAANIRIECLAEMSRIEQIIYKEFKAIRRPDRVIVPRFKKDGNIIAVGLHDILDNPKLPNVQVVGELTRLKLEEFTIHSPTQIVRRMEYYKWKPVQFNKPSPLMKQEGRKGTPIICEENINTLPDTAPKSAKLIGTYMMCKSRANLIEQWVKAVGSDGRMHGTMFSVGAITNRCAHIQPNMGNIPSIEMGKDHKPILGIKGRFGFECRDCFTVDDVVNRRLVGVDAKSIQLRALAHYLNNPSYITAVSEGDVHEVNREAAGLDSRDTAKTFIYAFLLGAGDKKLGTIVKGTTQDGKDLRERFMSRIKGLTELREQCDEDANRGYMLGIDGRCIPVKSAHFALSSYLQGFEAVVMKTAYINSYRTIKYRNLDAMTVAFVHDEFQSDCHKLVAEEVGTIQIEAIRRTTSLFNLNCPLDGEMKIGTTWANTH